MFWLGLLRAFTSKAQTPIRHGLMELDSTSLMELAAVLGAVLALNLLGARLEERVDCPIIPVGRGSDPDSAFAGWLWEDFVLGLAECRVVGSGTRPVGVWSLYSESKSDDGGPVVELGSVGGFKESASAEEPLLCSIPSIGND